MTTNINMDNTFQIEGHISRLNIFAEGKACNITIGVKNGTDKDTFVTVKCLSPAVFENLVVGMLVRIVGHIGNAFYVKDGQIVYKDNNDLIADACKYNETKKTSEKRAIKQMYAKQ